MARAMSPTALKKRVVSLQKSTQKARAKAGEIMENAIASAEIGGTAFALGILEGRTPPGNKEAFEVMGVPIPLVTTLAAHAFALFGVGRGMESHFRAIGNGALATHLNGIGRRMGTEMLERQTVSGDAGPASLPPKREGMSITADQLAELAL